VVPLDVRERIEVVDHDAVGLAHRLLGGVRQPVQALEPRAVAQVETSYRIAGASRSVLGLQK
jgi:hypothetical protein